MGLTLILIFALAYAAIVLEHPLRINKSASALLGAGLLWTLYALCAPEGTPLEQQLSQTLVGTAQIVFFLMGAMTIVEVIDSHGGFAVITSRIKTDSAPILLLLVAVITFFLSAILDNLTTAIVMVSLMKKLLTARDQRLLFAAVIVLAANAGGAWSPIGDVTTTMLWMGGQVSAPQIIKTVFFPSLVSVLLPLGVFSWRLRGQKVVAPLSEDLQAAEPHTSAWERNIMFFLGLGVLMAVPVFKTLTHLPPFMGVLLGLGLLWLAGDLLHRNKEDMEKQRLTLTHALTRIDMPSIVFFIGILLAVATLEHAHILSAWAQGLEQTLGRQDLIVILIGLVSAVVDNVPLVAATMGMYSLQQYPVDSFLWAFLAYCAGTGGSILIVGSAAGVAAMGLEKMNFVWYLKHISGWALLGYLAGACVFVVPDVLGPWLSLL
jgi:Na+/H+ antiporter NhaD/arsenite permease-like protein